MSIYLNSIIPVGFKDFNFLHRSLEYVDNINPLKVYNIMDIQLYNYVPSKAKCYKNVFLGMKQKYWRAFIYSILQQKYNYNEGGEAV